MTQPPAHPDLVNPIVKPKQRRGFACMDPEKRKLIAQKGGGSVKPQNRSFAKDRKLAMRAGKKGGLASRGGGRKAKAAADREAERLYAKYDGQ